MPSTDIPAPAHEPLGGRGAPPAGDAVDEARLLLRSAAADSIPVHLLGGVAIRLSVPDGDRPLFGREFADIDVITPRTHAQPFQALLQRLGYLPDAMFNALNGHRRLLFTGERSERKLDVFVGSFSMCHTVPVRFERADVTVALAELLLTKLQVFRVTKKDQQDLLTLLFHHPLTEASRPPIADGLAAIEVDYVAAVCGSDWGLWRTCSLNLERLANCELRNRLSAHDGEVVEDRIRQLQAWLQNTPKTRRWKARSKIGDRLQWYDDPEEVN